MCVVRLVLQDLYGDFSRILDRSKIIQYLRGLYVDNGRKIVNRLELGTRLVKDEMMSQKRNSWETEDILNQTNRKILTEIEIREAMNSINPDLTFTMENEANLDNNILPNVVRT